MEVEHAAAPRQLHECRRFRSPKRLRLCEHCLPVAAATFCCHACVVSPDGLSGEDERIPCCRDKFGRVASDVRLDFQVDAPGHCPVNVQKGCLLYTSDAADDLLCVD